MIDLNRNRKQQTDETPTGVVILALLPMVMIFVALIEVMA